MRHIVHFALFLALGAAASPRLAGQNIPITVSPAMEVEESIGSDEVVRVSAAAEKILNDYAEKGHMTNAQGITTQLAGNEFKGLFKATARIFADYLQYPSGTGDDVAAYRQTVLQKFPETGFPYTINNAELTGVSGEGYRFFVVKIRFNKSIKEYIDGKGRTRMAATDGSRNFLLEMTAEISTSDLDQYRIRQIVCADGCGKKAADRVRYLSATAEFAIPVISQNPLAIAGVSSGPEAQTFEQGLQIGGGVRFTSNFFAPEGASNKNLFLTGGVNFSHARYTARLDNYSLEPFPDPAFDGVTFGGQVAGFQRMVTAVEVTEKLSTTSIEVPLGLSYRLIDGYDRVLMLDLVAKPAFILNSSVEWTRGRGRFDGELPAAKFSVLRDSEYQGATDPDSNPFNACNCNEVTRDESTELETGFGLWLMVSPTFYSNMDNNDPALGIQISLDFAFNVSSPLTSSPAERPYLRDPRGETGVLTNGYFDTKLHYIGIRAGVYLQKVSPINIR